MGTRGPAPKRIQERLGHLTKAQKSGVNTVVRQEMVEVPAIGDVHPIARAWYEALQRSGQSEYFEPSDWAAAVYLTEVMTRNLNTTRFSAQLFGVVWAAMDDLLTTEKARRRARIEVQRGLASIDPTAESEFEKYKRSVGR